MAANRLTDGLKSWPIAVLPHHLLSRVVRAATRWRVRWWKDLLMGWFIHHFRVDMAEAAEPAAGRYPDFNSFFTRALKPGARPQPEDARIITSPVDGRISQIGRIAGDTLLQAKGRNYSLSILLGGHSEHAASFENGCFATLYLSPRDYHRIHMPCDARLRETAYIPGRLFSVAPHTTRAIPGLFTRNERLAAIFDTRTGPMAMVMVGAIFVACMETVWAGVHRPRGRGVRIENFATAENAALRFSRGDEMGRFNMGSTVILLFGPGQVEWDAALKADLPLRLGQPLGYPVVEHGTVDA